MNYRSYVELEGFLGRNAEQKLISSSKSLTILALAVKESWQKDGQWDHAPTDFESPGCGRHSCGRLEEGRPNPR